VEATGFIQTCLKPGSIKQFTVYRSVGLAIKNSFGSVTKEDVDTEKNSERQE